MGGENRWARVGVSRLAENWRCERAAGKCTLSRYNSPSGFLRRQSWDLDQGGDRAVVSAVTHILTAQQLEATVGVD